MGDVMFHGRMCAGVGIRYANDRLTSILLQGNADIVSKDRRMDSDVIYKLFPNMMCKCSSK